jgi:hypothetical protein
VPGETSCDCGRAGPAPDGVQKSVQGLCVKPRRPGCGVVKDAPQLWDASLFLGHLVRQAPQLGIRVARPIQAWRSVKSIIAKSFVAARCARYPFGIGGDP